jgi:hypothetical protein
MLYHTNLMCPSSKPKFKFLFNDSLSTDRFQRTMRDIVVCEHTFEGGILLFQAEEDSAVERN